MQTEIMDNRLPEPHQSRALNADALSLFLDLDGTLAPFAPTPEAVEPDPERSALLRQLGVRFNGRLAIVSGRSLGEVDRIVEGRVVCVAGCHGLQRRDARLEVTAPKPSSGLKDATKAMTTFARKHGLLPEEKPFAVALHYRQRPELEALSHDFARALSTQYGLNLQAGKSVVELLMPGMDKGSAIRAFMQEPPFVGTIPVFAGDDLTDEAGFKAVASKGGFGILVGPARDTAALYRVPDIATLMQWLGQLAQTGTADTEALEWVG